MRRLIVELSVEDVIRFHADSPIRKIESVELVQLFNQSGGKLEGIMRVAFKDPRFKIEDIFPKERMVMHSWITIGRVGFTPILSNPKDNTLDAKRSASEDTFPCRSILRTERSR